MNSQINSLADNFVTVFDSPSPQDVYCYSPSIAVCPSGRLVASCDFGGPGVESLNGAKASRGADYTVNQGRISVSDNGGNSWRYIQEFPMLHATVFTAGESLYLIGHAGDLGIMRSDDWGESWSDISWLTEGQDWHQAPTNVCYANGKVYLVMERYVRRGWSYLAPVVMAGKVGDDLSMKKSWTFSNELTFDDAADSLEFKYLGVPFFTPGPQLPDNEKDHRDMATAGWLESNIVQFTDPNHVWFDPSGRTFHIWMRAHTGATNMACIAKAVESEDGSITVSLEKSPAGVEMLYVPCPGGQMKFHIVYDEITKLYWLLSTQTTDSMVTPGSLPADRFNLPNNERQRLVLHFSRNCIDWCFAGMVAMGRTQLESRHYASMAIDGDDLCVLSRSGDERAASAHNGNLITFHRVEKFRKLVY